MAGVNVALPASIVSYDAETQRAVVRVAPCRRRKDPDQGGAVVCYRPPDIPGVPVLFPGGGDISLVWPLAAGDRGLVVVCDRSIDEWLATGAAQTEPQDERRHDLTDSVFVPGLRPFADPVPAAGRDATATVLRASLIKLGSASASDFVALSSKVDAQLSALKALLDGWTPSGGDGGGALKAAWSTLSGTGWPASTAATKVQAE